VGVEVDTIKWFVTVKGQADIADIRAVLGEESYTDGTNALRALLCDYFETGACIAKGVSVSPLGTNSRGGKVLKVRWILPGRGKSGGLRICFAAYCERRVVVLCRAFLRKDEPKAEDFDDAAELAAEYADLDRDAADDE
jgi:hypothetical protein